MAVFVEDERVKENVLFVEVVGARLKLFTDDTAFALEFGRLKDDGKLKGSCGGAPS